MREQYCGLVTAELLDQTITIAVGSIVVVITAV